MSAIDTIGYGFFFALLFAGLIFYDSVTHGAKDKTRKAEDVSKEAQIKAKEIFYLIGGTFLLIAIVSLISN